MRRTIHFTVLSIVKFVYGGILGDDSTKMTSPIPFNIYRDDKSRHLSERNAHQPYTSQLRTGFLAL